MRSAAIGLVALAIVAWPGTSRADDIGTDEDTEEGCILAEVCPETGVRCERDRCDGEDHCPNSMVTCSDEEPGDTCEADAARAGLERRCYGSHDTLYCDPDEKAREGSAPACHANAAAKGLRDECIAPDYATLYCGKVPNAGEDESGAEGERDEADDGSCSLNRRRRSGVGFAFAVFVGAAAVSGLRAWRRRVASERLR